MLHNLNTMTMPQAIHGLTPHEPGEHLFWPTFIQIGLCQMVPRESIRGPCCPVARIFYSTLVPSDPGLSAVAGARQLLRPRTGAHR
jgi:hypothetical protein